MRNLDSRKNYEIRGKRWVNSRDNKWENSTLGKNYEIRGEKMRKLNSRDNKWEIQI